MTDPSLDHHLAGDPWCGCLTCREREWRDLDWVYHARVKAFADELVFESVQVDPVIRKTDRPCPLCETDLWEVVLGSNGIMLGWKPVCPSCIAVRTPERITEKYGPDEPS